MARIVLVRSGGLAGMSLRGEVDTDAPDEPDAGWYSEFLGGLDLAGLAAAAEEGGADRAPGRPDRFTYALSVDAPGPRHELVYGESSLPEQLRPLVDRLMARARTRSGPR